MLKWYLNGIKYLKSFDIDSVCLGAFLLGIMVGTLPSPAASVNPLIYFILGVGLISAPTYKFIKREDLAFEPEVIVKTVIKEVPAKKKPVAKKAAVKKAVAKKPAAKKTPAKKPVAKKAPAKKTTKK